MNKAAKEIIRQGLIIHLEAGIMGALGLASHSYRRAACGARAERWLTTACSEWSNVRNVSCGRCKKTKLYKEKLGKRT